MTRSKGQKELLNHVGFMKTYCGNKREGGEKLITETMTRKLMIWKRFSGIIKSTSPRVIQLVDSSLTGAHMYSAT